MSHSLKCRDCKYFQPKYNDHTSPGYCKRHSPTCISAPPTPGEHSYYAHWPIVDHKDYCGDFEYKDIRNSMLHRGEI